MCVCERSRESAIRFEADLRPRIQVQSGRGHESLPGFSPQPSLPHFSRFPVPEHLPKAGPLPLVLGRELLGQCAPNSAPQADAPPQPHSWSPGLPPPTGAGAYSKSTVWTHTPAWGLTLNISTDRTLSLPAARRSLHPCSHAERGELVQRTLLSRGRNRGRLIWGFNSIIMPADIVTE